VVGHLVLRFKVYILGHFSSESLNTSIKNLHYAKVVSHGLSKTQSNLRIAQHLAKLCNKSRAPEPEPASREKVQNFWPTLAYWPCGRHCQCTALVGVALTARFIWPPSEPYRAMSAPSLNVQGAEE